MISIIIYIIIVHNLYYLSLSDPGFIPRRYILNKDENYFLYRSSKIIINKGKFSNNNLCAACFIYKSDKIYHCNECDCCILNHDHHSVYVGNCIGRNTFSNYICFILMSTIFFLFIFILSIVELSIRVHNKKSELEINLNENLKINYAPIAISEGVDSLILIFITVYGFICFSQIIFSYLKRNLNTLLKKIYKLLFLGRIHVFTNSTQNVLIINRILEKLHNQKYSEKDKKVIIASIILKYNLYITNNNKLSINNIHLFQNYLLKEKYELLINNDSQENEENYNDISPNHLDKI